MKYIKIPNFDSFQHYKDRRPTWIKLLIEIIDQFDSKGNEKKFYKLPDNAKLTFVMLLCLRAHYTEKIPFPSEKWLKERLGLSCILLKPLVDMGFIALDTETVSKPYQSGTPEKEREREKEKEGEEDIKSVFEHWNKQKEKGRWKSHTKLTPDIRDAIAENLKTWLSVEIKQAISNFAMVLQGKEYLWTYDKWGLREFLTRHEKDNRKGYQWWRFHPNTFREEDWLTDQVRQNRIKKQREQERRQQAMLTYIKENQKWIMEAEPALLIQHCRNDPRLAYVAKKLRPDIVIPEEK